MSYAIKMIKVECDGTVHEFSAKMRVGEVIKQIHGKKSGAIAALVNGEEKDLSHLLSENCEIKAIKDKRIHFIGEDYILIPGPRLVKILEKFTKIIHPDLSHSQVDKNSFQDNLKP